jgi:galactose mutarotase-like enzyme
MDRNTAITMMLAMAMGVEPIAILFDEKNWYARNKSRNLSVSLTETDKGWHIFMMRGTQQAEFEQEGFALQPVMGWMNAYNW